MTDDKTMSDKTNEPNTLDLRSHDIAEEKRKELLRLFPEIRAEGGKLEFERLKLALGETVDVGKERYRRLVSYGALFTPRKTNQEMLVEALDAYLALVEA